MAYVTYSPSKSVFFANCYKDYFLDSDISEYDEYSISQSNTNILNVFIEQRLIATVCELDIDMHELSITKKQLGNLRWGWLVQRPNENQLLTFDSNNNLILENRVVAKFSGNYNMNLLLLIWKLIKGERPLKNNLKLEFDETVIEPSFAFCLLFKELCRRCNS